MTRAISKLRLAQLAVAVVAGLDGEANTGRINQVLGFQGLERILVNVAEAGDIVLISGIEKVDFFYFKSIQKNTNILIK